MSVYKRIVVKIGTKVIASKTHGVDRERIADLSGQMVAVMDAGCDVVLVTSGAIGSGMSVLGLKRRPVELSELQAAAAIGQTHLMDIYGDALRKRGHIAGQILLTQEDFNDRRRYLNINQTIKRLLAHRALPIINENDTVATDEIKCGDNDRLSSLVADLCEAEALVLLSDVDGLYDERGVVIERVDGFTSKVMKLGGKSACDLGTGGMGTKLEAARRVTEAGIDCIIANGRARDVLAKIVSGERVGTFFPKQKRQLQAKKRWIAYSSKPKGTVSVDAGAVEALVKRNKSLLASGVVGVSGAFRAGDVVSISDAGGTEFARGVVACSSRELDAVKGLKTGQIAGRLGRAGLSEVVHRDTLVVL